MTRTRSDVAFEKWWIDYRGFPDPHDGVARDAWNAAIEAVLACTESVEDEREVE